MPRPLSQGKKPFRHLSASDVDRILSTPAPALAAPESAVPKQPASTPSPQPPAQPVRIFPPASRVLCRRTEYDSLHPTQQLRSFVSFLRAVQPRYNENFRIVGECDLQGQDILHRTEMDRDMDLFGGYRMYKLTREVRRKRRVCKNENDLLRPVFTFLEQHPDFITTLERLLGDVARTQSAIDERRYTMRTDIFVQDG